MAGLTPHWIQPSHPEIQEVQYAKEGFFTKSFSKIDVKPFGLFAKLSYPPCTVATEPTYATVQCGKNSHLNLNSDLLYINHSCDPSLIFDIPSNSILAGPRGLKPNDELTFFYPSTEWSMAQGFDCFCGAKTCKGFINGAGKMPKEKLEGLWLNPWIREMIEERDGGVEQAKRGIVGFKGEVNGKGKVNGDGGVGTNGHVNGMNGEVEKDRKGPSSRELSGEMGGDTVGQ